MPVALQTRLMTQTEFFGWAQTQDTRYEFDGTQPVAMTGGSVGHSQISSNIQLALRTRLQGGPCRSLGPDAGLETIGNAVRYPDALITCSQVRDDALVVPGVVIVFEVVSQSSERTDRIEKLREYQAVSSILRYVIVERTSIGLSVFERAAGDAPWTASALVAGDMLRLPEAGIEIPVADLYLGTELAASGDAAE